MKNETFAQWCENATRAIRYKPDRKAVSDELMAHLEDHRDALMEQGICTEEAEAQALQDMGSADLIAEDLAKVHTPWLGYLLRTVRVAGILLCSFAVYVVFLNIGSFLSMWIRSENFDAIPANYAPLDAYWQTDVRGTSDGYLFRITEVGIPKDQALLCFDLWSAYPPGMAQSAINTHFWATDSNGNYYASRSEANYEDIPKVTSAGGSYTCSLGICSMQITHFDTTAQWVELHYDRDGRDLVLHIDLTGGDRP